MHSGSRPPATTPSAIGLLLASALLACPPPCGAQVPEYQLKAEFLERFARFIEWPSGSSASAPGAAFVIGVLGDDPFGPYLEGLKSRGTIKGKPIRVVAVSEPAGIDACHVLFIARSERKDLAGILARTAARPILTVGDTEGYAERGVIINFFTLENRIGFEVNDEAARRSGLRLSSQLLRLARLVKMEAHP